MNISQNWAEFEDHHKKHHSTISSLPQPYIVVINNKYYKCNLCQRDILHDTSLIEYHLKVIHKISYKNYRKEITFIY